MGYRSPAYIDENLKADYNHLESRQCFCQKPKDMGALMCLNCLASLPAGERVLLAQMRPGEGVASAAAIEHGKVMRARKGLFG
jgi:hypothetical protein